MKYGKIFEANFGSKNFNEFIVTLEAIDNVYNNVNNIGDYTGFGVEFILSGINPKFYGCPYYVGASDIIDLTGFKNNLLFNFNNYSSFLYFNPSDRRCLIFDFGYLSINNKIIAYDGLEKPFNMTAVREFTPEEFVHEYGNKRFLSATHYRVNWNHYGISWNN